MGIRANRVKQKLAGGEAVSIVLGLDDSDWIDQFGPVGFDVRVMTVDRGRVPAIGGEASDLVVAHTERRRAVDRDVVVVEQDDEL